VEQKEVTAANATLRKITYAYDDAGNLTMEQRSGVDVDRKDENVRYYYDGANQLVRTVIEGQTRSYTYDLAGNLLSDGESIYTYDAQNRLLSETGADGTTTYTYDAAGNLLKKVSPDGSTEYAYTAQNKLESGKQADGQSSTYTYNALGVRIQNVQVRKNQNSGYANADLNNGSEHIKDYLSALSDDRADWQRVWESEVGSVHQNDFETVTTHYTVDYLSVANRDIMVTEDGSWTARYVYDEDSTRISAEFSYADGTARGTTNADGEYGENPASDIAVSDISKVWYRTSLLGSTLYAIDATGQVLAHAVYDPWGQPLTETYTDTNFSGLTDLNNFTGYTWDEVLGLYFAQTRFYDAENHRFTQEDAVKDGANWYVYAVNNVMMFIDPSGLWTIAVGGEFVAAFGIRLAVGVQLVYDDDGNIGFLRYSALGGGFPALGGAVVLTGTNADTIYDLEGAGVAVGGGINVAGVSVGLEFTAGSARDGSPVVGATVAFGAKMELPLEMHGEMVTTTVISANWMKWFVDVKQIHAGFFQKLSCAQKSEIIRVTGVSK
jgi:RHS repeat-associated protein